MQRGFDREGQGGEEGGLAGPREKVTLGGCAMALIVLSAAVALLWVLSSGLVGQMAERKGHSNLHWNVFSLFCSPLIGFIVVALLPSIGDLNPAAYKQCALCSNMVKVEETTCPYCQADLQKQSGAEKKAA